MIVVRDARPGADMLDAGHDAIVSPVNCLGTAGKGLALAIANRHPGAKRTYAAACRTGALRIGTVHVWDRTADPDPADDGLGVTRPRYVIHLPTKDDWRRPSLKSYVAQGCDALARALADHRITDVGIPALGCGLGGLDWADVGPIIRQSLGAASAGHHATATLYPPR